MDQKTLHEWLNYDGQTGVFTWRKSPSQSVAAGDQAGHLQKLRSGGQRRTISIKGQRFYAGRAAYIYAHGDIPKSMLVDHINGDPTDDRLCNLRLAGTAENTWNRRGKRGAKYLKGVTRTERGRYKARIQAPNSNKKINLGTWDTEREAHAAYIGAAAVLHGEFWVGERPDVQRARATEAQEKRK